MIHLEKGEPPQILEKNAQRWTQAYLDHVGARDAMPDSVRYRYRHPEIKTALKHEARDKCVYCESQVLHIDSGETDHFKPLSLFPELVLDWVNLSFACHECNRLKRDYYRDTAPLLNPFSDEPDEHLMFAGALVIPRPGDDLGEITIETLELNRTSLFERRNEKLKVLNKLVSRWARLSLDHPLRTSAEREILEFACAGMEYAAAVRAFLIQLSVWTREAIGNC